MPSSSKPFKKHLYCKGCQKGGATLICSRCGCVAYCSKECADKTWFSGHSKTCRRVDSFERDQLENCFDRLVIGEMVYKHIKGRDDVPSDLKAGLRAAIGKKPIEIKQLKQEYKQKKKELLESRRLLNRSKRRQSLEKIESLITRKQEIRARSGSGVKDYRYYTELLKLKDENKGKRKRILTDDQDPISKEASRTDVIPYYRGLSRSPEIGKRRKVVESTGLTVEELAEWTTYLTNLRRNQEAISNALTENGMLIEYGVCAGPSIQFVELAEAVDICMQHLKKPKWLYSEENFDKTLKLFTSMRAALGTANARAEAMYASVTAAGSDHPILSYFDLAREYNPKFFVENDVYDTVIDKMKKIRSKRFITPTPMDISSSSSSSSSMKVGPPIIGIDLLPDSLESLRELLSAVGLPFLKLSALWTARRTDRSVSKIVDSFFKMVPVDMIKQLAYQLGVLTGVGIKKLAVTPISELLRYTFNILFIAPNTVRAVVQRLTVKMRSFIRRPDIGAEEKESVQAENESYVTQDLIPSIEDDVIKQDAIDSAANIKRLDSEVASDANQRETSRLMRTLRGVWSGIKGITTSIIQSPLTPIVLEMVAFSAVTCLVDPTSATYWSIVVPWFYRSVSKIRIKLPALFASLQNQIAILFSSFTDYIKNKLGIEDDIKKRGGAGADELEELSEGTGLPKYITKDMKQYISEDSPILAAIRGAKQNTTKKLLQLEVFYRIGALTQNITIDNDDYQKLADWKIRERYDAIHAEYLTTCDEIVTLISKRLAMHTRFCHAVKSETGFLGQARHIRDESQHQADILFDQKKAGNIMILMERFPIKAYEILIEEDPYFYEYITSLYVLAMVKATEKIRKVVATLVDNLEWYSEIYKSKFEAGFGFLDQKLAGRMVDVGALKKESLSTQVFGIYEDEQLRGEFLIDGPTFLEIMEYDSRITYCSETLLPYFEYINNQSAANAVRLFLQNGGGTQDEQNFAKVLQYIRSDVDPLFKYANMRQRIISRYGLSAEKNAEYNALEEETLKMYKDLGQKIIEETLPPPGPTPMEIGAKVKDWKSAFDASVAGRKSTILGTWRNVAEDLLNGEITLFQNAIQEILNEYIEPSTAIKDIKDIGSSLVDMLQKSVLYGKKNVGELKNPILKSYIGTLLNYMRELLPYFEIRLGEYKTPWATEESKQKFNQFLVDFNDYFLVWKNTIFTYREAQIEAYKLDNDIDPNDKTDLTPEQEKMAVSPNVKLLYDFYHYKGSSKTVSKSIYTARAELREAADLLLRLGSVEATGTLEKAFRLDQVGESEFLAPGFENLFEQLVSSVYKTWNGYLTLRDVVDDHSEVAVGLAPEQYQYISNVISLDVRPDLDSEGKPMATGREKSIFETLTPTQYNMLLDVTRMILRGRINNRNPVPYEKLITVDENKPQVLRVSCEPAGDEKDSTDVVFEILEPPSDSQDLGKDRLVENGKKIVKLSEEAAKTYFVPYCKEYINKSFRSNSPPSLTDDTLRNYYIDEFNYYQDQKDYLKQRWDWHFQGAFVLPGWPEFNAEARKYQEFQNVLDAYPDWNLEQIIFDHFDEQKEADPNRMRVLYNKLSAQINDQDAPWSPFKLLLFEIVQNYFKLRLGEIMKKHLNTELVGEIESSPQFVKANTTVDSLSNKTEATVRAAWTYGESLPPEIIRTSAEHFLNDYIPALKNDAFYHPENKILASRALEPYKPSEIALKIHSTQSKGLLAPDYDFKLSSALNTPSLKRLEIEFNPIRWWEGDSTRLQVADNPVVTIDNKNYVVDNPITIEIGFKNVNARNAFKNNLTSAQTIELGASRRGDVVNLLTNFFVTGFVTPEQDDTPFRKLVNAIQNNSKDFYEGVQNAMSMTYFISLAKETPREQFDRMFQQYSGPRTAAGLVVGDKEGFAVEYILAKAISSQKPAELNRLKLDTSNPFFDSSVMESAEQMERFRTKIINKDKLRCWFIAGIVLVAVFSLVFYFGADYLFTDTANVMKVLETDKIEGVVNEGIPLRNVKLDEIEFNEAGTMKGFAQNQLIVETNALVARQNPQGFPTLEAGKAVWKNTYYQLSQDASLLSLDPNAPDSLLTRYRTGLSAQDAELFTAGHNAWLTTNNYTASDTWSAGNVELSQIGVVAKKMVSHINEKVTTPEFRDAIYTDMWSSMGFIGVWLFYAFTGVNDNISNHINIISNATKASQEALSATGSSLTNPIFAILSNLAYALQSVFIYYAAIVIFVLTVFFVLAFVIHRFLVIETDNAFFSKWNDYAKAFKNIMNNLIAIAIKGLFAQWFRTGFGNTLTQTIATVILFVLNSGFLVLFNYIMYHVVAREMKLDETEGLWKTLATDITSQLTTAFSVYVCLSVFGLQDVNSSIGFFLSLLSSLGLAFAATLKISSNLVDTLAGWIAYLPFVSTEYATRAWWASLTAWVVLAVLVTFISQTKPVRSFYNSPPVRAVKAVVGWAFSRLFNFFLGGMFAAVYYGTGLVLEGGFALIKRLLRIKQQPPSIEGYRVISRSMFDELLKMVDKTVAEKEKKK